MPPSGPAPRSPGVRPPRVRSLCRIVGAAVLLSSATSPRPAGAQTLDDLREEVADALAAGRYTALLTAFVDLSVEQVVSAGDFTVDDDPDLRVRTIKLPFDLTIGNEDDPALFFEGNIGALRAEADFPDLYGGALPGLETRAESEWSSVGVLGGVGIRFPVAAGVSITPVVDIAISYLENDVRYEGPGSELSAALLDGLLFEWDATVFSYGGGILVETEHSIGRGLATEGALRYDIRASEAIESSDDAQDVDDLSHRIALRGDLTGPTGLAIDERALGWRLFASYVALPGETGDSIGIEGYFELGAGISLDVAQDLPLLSEVELQVVRLRGDGVEGWSIGFSASF